MTVNWNNQHSVEKAIQGLSNNTLTFKEVVDDCKASSQLWILVCDKDSFSEMQKKNLLKTEDFLYLLKSIDSLDTLSSYNKILREFVHEKCGGSDVLSSLKYFYDIGLVSLSEVVDICTNIRDSQNDSMLILLMNNDFLRKRVLSRHALTRPSVEALLSSVNNSNEITILFSKFHDNFFSYLLDNNLATFKELVDVHQKADDLTITNKATCINRFFNNSVDYALIDLVAKSKIDRNDLKYLLNSIKDFDIEIAGLFTRTPEVATYCFKHFIFDEKLIKKFDELRENSKWSRYVDLENFFEYAKKPLHSSNEVEMFEKIFSLPLSDEEKEAVSNLLSNTTSFEDIKQRRKEVEKEYQRQMQKFDSEEEAAQREMTRRQEVFNTLATTGLVKQYDFDQLQEIVLRNEIGKKKYKLNF